MQICITAQVDGRDAGLHQGNGRDQEAPFRLDTPMGPRRDTPIAASAW